MQDFWKGRRVFITGHTGFKGAWLAFWLSELGADVTGYALAPETEPNLYTLLDLQQRVNSIIDDIRDEAKLASALAAAQPDIVFHLAAQPLVRKSYREPVSTFQTNVMGSIHLLEACRQCDSVKSIVVVTSDKCYENQEWAWGYRESEKLGGHDPYSASKACTELLAQSWRLSFFNEANKDSLQACNLATVRAGNVIGGGDWSEDRLIPDILRALGEGEDVDIRNPHAIRPWQHVLEPLAGYLLLAEKLFAQDGEQWAQAWNFGPADEDARPVSWIVENLTSQWPTPASWKMMEGDHPHEAHYLKLDCSLARDRLGWKPAWNLEQCLQHIVSWQSRFLAGDDMQAASIDLLNHYMRESRLFEVS
ncbi:MAG: CDP-glucose 4,6-dehydratase [Granulosicoccus sp.]